MPEDPFIQPFFAYCQRCNKLVTVVPLFTKTQASHALQTGGDLEVMHTAASGGDHRWALDLTDREHLRKAMRRAKV